MRLSVTGALRNKRKGDGPRVTDWSSPIRVLLVPLLVLCALAGVGCGVRPGPSCEDCGPCGIVGSNPGTELNLTKLGLDSSNRLVAQLGAGRAGDCGTPNLFWLDGDGNFGAAPSGGQLDSKLVGSGRTDAGEPSYTYSLTRVTFARHSATEGVVTFYTQATGTTAERTLTRTCSTLDGLAISCS